MSYLEIVTRAAVDLAKGPVGSILSLGGVNIYTHKSYIYPKEYMYIYNIYISVSG